MINQRLLSLDYIRALACFLVILIHSPFSGDNSNGFYMASATLLGLPCNGLFFMVSGYLLLPVTDSTSYFIMKRLSKVLFPTLFWTFFYIILNVIIGNTHVNELWCVFFSIPFSPQGTGWLWFMYVMIGLYLLAPILSSWIKNVNQSEFVIYLCLCLITSLFPLFGKYVEIAKGENNMLFYFSGYIVYFLLGAYLKKYPSRFPLWAMVCSYIIPIMVALVARIYEIHVISEQFTSYLSIFTISMCLALFCLLVRYETFFKKHIMFSSWVSDISKCSFGIYLIHHFVNHQLIDRAFFLEEYGSLFQIIISVVLTLFISYTIVWGISWLPFSEYIVGYKRKTNCLRTTRQDD